MDDDARGEHLQRSSSTMIPPPPVVDMDDGSWLEAPDPTVVDFASYLPTPSDDTRNTDVTGLALDIVVEFDDRGEDELTAGW